LSTVVTELVIDSDTSGADRFSQSMDKASSSAQQGVNSAAGMSLAIAGVGIAFVGALVGLRSFFDYVGQQNKQLVDIAENARNAGMTARDFQETLFAARSKGLTEKDFVSGLDKITTDLTAASSGVTEFGRLFEANGLKIKNANGELKNSKQALADIAGLMQNASPVIQQGIAKIVGLSKDWIPFLRDGADAIEKQKKSAADLGVVISDEVIAKSKEFDAQWKTAIATWDLQFKASLAGIMPLLVKMATLASTIIEGVGTVNSSVSRWMTPDEDKSKAQLNDQINQVAQLRDMMESLAKTGGEFKKFQVTNLAELLGLGGDATIKDVDALLTKLAALYDKAPTRITVNAPGSTVLPANENKDALDREIDRLQKHIAVTKADAESVGQSEAARAGLRAEATLYAAAEHAGFTDLEKFAEKFLKIREAVEGSTQALNKAKIAADIKLGRDTAFLSSEDLQIAMKLKDSFNNDIPAALGSSEAAALRFNNQLKQMNDVARSSATQFSDDLIKGLASGQTAVESLHNAFKNLASTLTSSALKSLFEGDFISAGIKGIAAAAAAIFSANTSSSGEKWLKEQTTNMNSRLADYAKSVAAVGVDTNTRQGAILTQDAQFTSERIAENKAGGQAMNQLLQLQVQERNQLMKEWDAKDTATLQANADAKLAIEKAAADRSLSFQDRVFAAANDNTTLEGQLAAFDRAAQKDRLTEASNGNQAIVDLEAAQAAERLNVVKSFADKEVAAVKAAEQAKLDAINGAAKNVLNYIAGLQSGPSSTFSPQTVLTNAASAYNANLAVGLGNPANQATIDAVNKFPELAENFRVASRAVNASSVAYQNDLNQIISQGLALPAVQNATDPLVIEMRNVLGAINAAAQTQALDATLQGVIKAAIDAGNAQQIAALLVPKFDTLNTTSDQGLDFTEFVRGLGPSYNSLATDSRVGGLLTDAQLRAAGINVSGPLTNAQMSALGLSLEQGNVLNVWRELDGNGNGILEKSEAIRAASRTTQDNTRDTNTNVGNVAANTYGAAGNTRDTNLNVGASNTLLDAIKSLQGTANTQLTLLRLALSPTVISKTFSGGSGSSGATLPGGGSGRDYILQNQVVDALNKIVLNTYLLTQNTAYTDKSYQYAGDELKGHGYIGIYAQGGLITGPGTGTSDSLLIRASNREYMMQNSALEKFGVGFFDQLNAGVMPRSIGNDNNFRPIISAPNVLPFRNGSAGSDNAALLARIDKLTEQVEVLQKIVAGSGANIARTVEANGDKIKGSVDNQTGTLAAQERQSNRQRKAAGG
jgi:hypothetical protein